MRPALSLRIRTRLKGFTLDTAWRVSGGFTVLFGYSGAGKSLTLATLTGLIRPDEGRITFGERVLLDTEVGICLPPQQRRFGYVSQSGALFPHLSVQRNVGFGLVHMSRAERAERVDEMLESLGIADLAERRPHEISGGQASRVALARALAPGPDALVLDEPLNALDLPVRAEMRALLRRVQREAGIPVVMVTHDLFEAAELADTLVVYSGTGVTQTGSVSELIGDPGTPEIKRLLRSIELPERLVNRTARPLPPPPPLAPGSVLTPV